MAVPLTPEQERQASAALWAAKAERDAAQLETILAQLEAPIDEISVDNLPAEVRTEVELRFFPAKAASKLSSSEQDIEGSSIAGGVGGGSGSGSGSV